MIEFWYNKVYRSYISNLDGISRLLLNDFKSHKDGMLQRLENEENILRYMMPPHYTSV